MTKAFQKLYNRLLNPAITAGDIDPARNSTTKIVNDLAEILPELPIEDGQYYLDVDNGDYSFSKKS